MTIELIPIKPLPVKVRMMEALFYMLHAFIFVDV